MSEHRATVHWDRGKAAFIDNRYSRRHVWRFDGGAEIPASASPHVVPVPMSDPAAVDPEEAFVAAISSCHMLWFLSIAARRGFIVENYDDEAVGMMGKDSNGLSAITEVTLRPAASFAGEKRPTRADIRAMHEEAHEKCFIANSVRTSIRCQPVSHVD